MQVYIYDTTLRDGAQREGLSLTVNDKLKIASKVDELGVAYIEGGWPGSNPKDDEFFARAKEELSLEYAALVAFGSTRRPSVTAEQDQNLAALLAAGTETICIVGKSWDYHVTDALQTTLDEGVRMTSDSVAYLRAKGKRVFFDAEHFFDGYKRNPDYALKIATAALESGAECIVLCDTNGGTLPHEVAQIIDEVRKALGSDVALGVHFHNDSGCAVANSLIAVERGVVQVQGCMNGLGERTGNANLVEVIPNLILKMGVDCIPIDRLKNLTEVAHYVAEVSNTPINPHSPYVGSAAFAHKAGLHTSAIARRPDAYEHIDPELVGNTSRLVVSELAGRSTVLLKAAELGLDLSARPEVVSEVLTKLKNLEHIGYHFEAADGSFELLVRTSAGWQPDYFQLESFRVIMEKRADGGVATEATIKVHARGKRIIATAEGNGPVNALDRALREAIGQLYPELKDVHLTDYKVRVLDPDRGTAAVTRVLIDTTDGHTSWSTIGVSENIIEASWQALQDSLILGILRAQEKDRKQEGHQGEG
jgi:2-isopropylmalate synthase